MSCFEGFPRFRLYTDVVLPANKPHERRNFTRLIFVLRIYTDDTTRIISCKQ